MGMFEKLFRTVPARESFLKRTLDLSDDRVFDLTRELYKINVDPWAPIDDDEYSRLLKICNDAIDVRRAEQLIEAVRMDGIREIWRSSLHRSKLACGI